MLVLQTNIRSVYRLDFFFLSSNTAAYDRPPPPPLADMWYSTISLRSANQAPHTALREEEEYI